MPWYFVWMRLHNMKNRWESQLLEGQSYIIWMAYSNFWKRQLIWGTLSRDVVCKIKCSHSDKDHFKGVWNKELQCGKHNVLFQTKSITLNYIKTPFGITLLSRSSKHVCICDLFHFKTNKILNVYSTHQDCKVLPKHTGVQFIARE